MIIAPLAALPIAAAAAVGRRASAAGPALPYLVTAALLIGVVALGSRGLHLDGLADTADGLAASYDRARALEIMRRGNTGPIGAATLVLVLIVQVAAAAERARAALGCGGRSAGWSACPGVAADQLRGRGAGGAARRFGRRGGRGGAATSPPVGLVLAAAVAGVLLAVPGRRGGSASSRCAVGSGGLCWWSALHAQVRRHHRRRAGRRDRVDSGRAVGGRLRRLTRRQPAEFRCGVSGDWGEEVDQIAVGVTEQQ